MRNLYFIFLVSVLLFSCKTDGSKSDTAVDEPLDIESIEIDMDETTEKGVAEAEVKLDEAISKEDMARKMLKESQEKEIDEVAKVEDKIDTKLTGKSEEQKKKEAKMKLEATKEAIDKSVNKGLSCDEMLMDQSKLVDEFAKAKDINIIRQLVKKQNDPFFQECMKVDAFAEKVEALQNRLDEIADQE